MAFIYDLADTWSGGGAFTGIKLNVTDSGSTAGSLLMDLQVGGVSRFRAVKDGSIELRTAGGVRTLFSSPSVGGGEARVGVSGSFTLSAGNADAGSSPDIFLNRDAANTLAQRNGVNAQAFNLYNTYTDASNYERVELKYASNVATLESIAGGTGTRRTLRLKSGGGSLDISNFAITCLSPLNLNGNLIDGVSYMQVFETTAPAAPAANNVRIYAEDDGAGKTRLMARFATGAAVQIAIEP